MSVKIESRRQFIKIVVLGAASAPLAGALLQQSAQAADLPHIDEADATASALGYHHDTTKVDAAKYATHKPDQQCSGCNLAQAVQADGWLPCSIFPGKSANPKGWCAAWVKKAG
jgi:High potential iron-sulfur protein